MARNQIDWSGNVGFVGLGQMGQGMARNLLKAGVSLHVYDSSEEVVAPLTDLGATSVNSLPDLGQNCDVIFLCLPFAPEVRAVLFGDNGLLSGLRAGTQIIDTTTLLRVDAIKICEEVTAAGFSYSDCPISGLPQRANDGTLTMMFGGQRAVFDNVEPLLEAMGSALIYCGSVGAGQAMKALNNIIYDINIVGLCEVIPLAVAAGLDPEQIAHVVTTGSSRSFASEHFVPRMLAREFSGDFPMGEAYKDVTNVQQLASETNASTPLIKAMTQSYDAALAAEYGAEPKSAILKVYEKALGVTFQKRT